MLDNVDKILTINNSQGFSRILLILWNQQKTTFLGGTLRIAFRM